jgi:hypothetical protein
VSMRIGIQTYIREILDVMIKDRKELFNTYVGFIIAFKLRIHIYL